MFNIPEKFKRKAKPDPYRRIERVVLMPMGCLSLLLVCNIIFLAGLILNGGELKLSYTEPFEMNTLSFRVTNPQVAILLTGTSEAATAQFVATAAAYEAPRMNCSNPVTDVGATNRLRKAIAQTEINPSQYTAVIQVLTDGQSCVRHIIISATVHKEVLSNPEEMGSETAYLLNILKNVYVSNPASIRVYFRQGAYSRTWFKNYDAAFEASRMYQGAALFESGEYIED